MGDFGFVLKAWVGVLAEFFDVFYPDHMRFDMCHLYIDGRRVARLEIPCRARVAIAHASFVFCSLPHLAGWIIATASAQAEESKTPQVSERLYSDAAPMHCE